MPSFYKLNWFNACTWKLIIWSINFKSIANFYHESMTLTLTFIVLLWIFLLIRYNLTQFEYNCQYGYGWNVNWVIYFLHSFFSTSLKCCMQIHMQRKMCVFDEQLCVVVVFFSLYFGSCSSWIEYQMWPLDSANRMLTPKMVRFDVGVDMTVHFQWKIN